MTSVNPHSPRKIGLTSTIPVEVVFAADAIPVDLNNLFVASEHARDMVENSERIGFPQNSCAWVKGLYAAARNNKITRIIGVDEGDCSQNCALMDIWRSEGLEIIPFSYPQRYSAEKFNASLRHLCDNVGADFADLEIWKERLDKTRSLASEVDRIAWQQKQVHSQQLFDTQLALSDFLGDPNQCHDQISHTLQQVQSAPAANSKIPLAVAGVPTIVSDLWDVIEDGGGRVIYHEVPHQFALDWGIGQSLEQTFSRYTYTAAAMTRIREIKRQVELRKPRGLIHYVQSFCHRQIHDIILRREIDIPVLTIEADRPGPTDGRTLTRIEAFLEQLS